MTYVHAAKQLPFLNNTEIDMKAREYGFDLGEQRRYSVSSQSNEKAEVSSRGSSQGVKREGSEAV